MRQVSKDQLYFVVENLENSTSIFCSEFDETDHAHDKRQIIARVATLLARKDDCIVIVIDKSGRSFN